MIEASTIVKLGSAWDFKPFTVCWNHLKWSICDRAGSNGSRCSIFRQVCVRRGGISTTDSDVSSWFSNYSSWFEYCFSALSHRAVTQSSWCLNLGGQFLRISRRVTLTLLPHQVPQCSVIIFHLTKAMASHRGLQGKAWAHLGYAVVHWFNGFVQIGNRHS